MESSSIICTPIAKQLEMKKEGSEELVNPTYFKGMVGSHHYLIYTRPDIIYEIGIISRFMKKIMLVTLASNKTNFEVCKWYS